MPASGCTRSRSRFGGGASDEPVNSGLRRRAQHRDDVEQRDRQRLPRAQVDRHAHPPPVVDVQRQRDVGLGGRPRLHAGRLGVAVVAAAHRLGRVDRPHRAQQAVLRVALVVGPLRRRRLHEQVGEHLQQVVLDDVAHGADGVVERAAVGDVEVLGHRDLEVVDPLPVPQRLEQRVGEPQHEQVLDRLLAEEVVDPEHPVLRVVLRDSRSFSASAEARSCPNGFSTISRERGARPAAAIPSATVPNSDGGTAR